MKTYQEFLQEELLLEKTYNINKDVDYIYKRFFKKAIDLYNKDLQKFNKYILGLQITKIGYTFGAFASFELQSKKAKKAAEINPIMIYCGVFERGSAYNVQTKIVTLSLNYSVVNLLTQMKSKEEFPDYVKGSKLAAFNNEISSTNIKGTIYHEISHWMNDTFHNENISRRVFKAAKSGGISDAMFTDFELDAQIHNIKQIKRDYKKSWDSITWKDLFQIDPSIGLVFKRLLDVSSKLQKDFMKRFLKRMHREKLLNKNLQKINKIRSIVQSIN